MLLGGMEYEQPITRAGSLALAANDSTNLKWRTTTIKNINISPCSSKRQKTTMTPKITSKVSTFRKYVSALTFRNHAQVHRVPVRSSKQHGIISTNTTALVKVILLLTLLATTDALFPSRCTCNDETLRASCEDAGLEVVPIQLNPNVKTISLRDNRIGDVHFTLAFYSNLRSLDVSRNRISSLGSKNFELQEKLVSLNASGNQIANLSKFTFSGLKSLRVLDLSRNLIESLEGGVWEDSPNLWEMHLRSNKIITIGEGVFDPLINLKVLDLSDNQLLDVPTGALGRLPSLKTLNLGDNLVESISGDAIPNLRDLKFLSLSSNIYVCIS